MHGGISDPEMRSCPTRVALTGSMKPRLVFGKRTVELGFPHRAERYRPGGSHPPFVGVINVWKRV